MRPSLAISIALLMLPLAAAAQTGGMSKSASDLSGQDQSFVKKAAAAGMAEVQDGQLAQSKGGPAVRAIGARMVTDHTKADDQLLAIAHAQDIMAPSTVSARQRAMTAKLQNLQGAAFDSAYLAGQRAAHERAIALFETEAATGQDPQLKSFAASTLPILRTHLQMIEAAQK